MSIFFRPSAAFGGERLLQAIGQLPVRSSERIVSAMKGLVIVGLLLAVFISDAAPRLKVSDNKRFLVREDGSPFFYLGDTAWELFHRLNREEADRYLDDRARKGFTVIQAVALAELDGLNDPNAYGHKPLINNDPAKPDVKDEDYWDHVDYVVNKAGSL